MAKKRFEVVDTRTVVDEAGQRYDVMDAVAALKWTRMWCPSMPHEYAILSEATAAPWFAIEAMVRLSPAGFRAYFRGYQRPNRYWDAPDGRRYWRGRYEIDRWWPDDEPLRRVDEGGTRITDWDGAPWAPNGSKLYVPGPTKGWWPSREAIANGYEPCRACQRGRPQGI